MDVESLDRMYLNMFWRRDLLLQWRLEEDHVAEDQRKPAERKDLNHVGGKRENKQMT